MTRHARLLAAALLAAILPAAESAGPTEPAAPAQDPVGEQAVVLPPDAAAVPFGVGERTTYDVRFGPVKVGSGSMEIPRLQAVRGRETYQMVFRVRGGTMFYKVDDTYESFVDVRTLASLRHRQDIDEGTRERERNFEIYPDRQVYSENGRAEQPSVRDPLDDGSFIYFVRTLPLEVGRTYEFNRYFRPDRNPVRIRVLRRERVTVPAGTFNTLVIQPIIKTKGIFSDKGEAHIWLTDDASRTMVQMKSKLSFGSLNLYLKEFRPATRASTIGPTTR